MKKNKKILLGALIIIIILALIIIIRETTICSDGNLDKTNIMKREDVIQLLNKGSTYKNYYFNPEQNPSTKDEELKTEYYIKDNILVTYLNSKLISWTDYNTGESISIIQSKSNNIAGISHNAQLIPNTQYGVDYSEIADTSRFNYEYTYLGEKEYNGRTAILVQLKNNNYYKKYLIDKDTGLILECIDITKKMGITTSKITSKQNIKLNVVTNEDIKKPDLSNYTIRESN